MPRQSRPQTSYELRVWWVGLRRPTSISPIHQKRKAIRQARRVCRWWDTSRVRRADVLRVEGRRSALIYQCHYSRRLKRIIAEEL